MKEKIFVNGMKFKEPSENAPEFIKGNISIKVADLIRFLTEHEKNGWVNIDLKEGKSGKKYFELNTWNKGGLSEEAKRDLAEIKRRAGFGEETKADDIPFD